MNPLHIIRDNLLRERDRWLLWAPLGIGTGIVLYFQWPYEPSLWVLAATPLLAAAIWFARRHFFIGIGLTAPLLIMLGFNAGQIDTKLVAAPMLERQIGPTSITGRLVFTEVLPEGVRLTLKNPQIERLLPEKTPLKIRIKLNRKTLADVPPTGSLINLWAEIGPFSEPVMPHSTDFRWQAFFRQLGGLGWSTSDIRLAGATPPATSWRDRFNLAFEQARMALTQHVYTHLSGDVAAMTAARLNGEQTGIFSLSAAVGLQRSGCKSGDDAQPFFQFADDLPVPLPLIRGCKWMYPAEFGPAYRNEFRGCVEFHGAGAQRYHGGIQRKILIFQALQVTHHFCFTVVRIENRVGEVR